MNPFRFHRPARLRDAIDRRRATEDGRFIAGGQSLLPTLKLGLASPTDLIDLSGIDGLAAIEPIPGGLRIGALATHAAVAGAPLVQQRIPALAQLAGRIGDPAVRSRGTLGGSLAHNDPAACYPAAMLALGARIVTDRRSIAAEDFFTGLYATALGADEVVVAVEIPAPQRAAWLKFLQPASRFSLVGVFYAHTAAGPRVAVTGAAACVFRATGIEQAIAAGDPAALERVQVPADSLNSDLHASAAYRAHLIPILARRALAQAAAS